jgi:uncharacterized membrane protein
MVLNILSPVELLCPQLKILKINKMKKYLVAGIIILVPIILTIMLFVFVVNIFTSPFLNIVTNLLMKFHQGLPLLKNTALLIFLARFIIILILCIFILLLGLIARGFIFKAFLNTADKILAKIPFVRTIYKAFKDMASSFSSNKRKAFTKTVMISFPSQDSYCIGFETGEVPEECQSKVKRKLIPVWVPTSPHPFSSFLVLAPVDEIHSIDMKNEDAVKFIISCGLIMPGENIENVLKK